MTPQSCNFSIDPALSANLRLAATLDQTTADAIVAVAVERELRRRQQRRRLIRRNLLAGPYPEILDAL